MNKAFTYKIVNQVQLHTLLNQIKLKPVFHQATQWANRNTHR